MSWLFSQALVAAYSEASCSDGAQSAPSNTTPTPQAFLSRDKTTDAWTRFPSGMRCEHLTADRGEELLTWFRAGFLARTYQSPAKAQALTASKADCGAKWRALLARYDRNTSSWKTHQLSFFEDLDGFSETWPKWGMMQDGECWELATLVLRTGDSESGFWPTPNVPNGGRSVKHCKDWRGKTPYHNGKKVQVGLEAAVKMWATPASRDYKGAPGAGCVARGGRQSSLPAQVGGSLNPTWVEWLMGWPIGFTDCAALATAKFQQWLHSHGVCSVGQQTEEEA